MPRVARATIVAQGRVIPVERREITTIRIASEPPPTLRSAIYELAHKLRHLAGPSRTRPHLFTETKLDLAAELERLAGLIH